MNIHGIIFDFDGTLIDTFDTHLRSWREAFESTGTTMNNDEFIKNFGKSHKDFTFSINPSLTNYDIDKIIQIEKKLMRERSNQYTLFPETYQVLEKLNEKNIQCMIASSNPRHVTEQLLEQFKIKHLIGKVVGPDDVKNGKPAPDMLLFALKHHNIDPKHSIMIGDTSHDILAGKNASTKTALILRREHQESVLATNPDYVLTNLKELFKFLD